MTDLAMHYVCTMGEAEYLVENADRFWVSNCGCRENREHCARSRMDVCLGFTQENTGSGSELREITRAEVESILDEAKKNHLVARPFRNEGRTSVEGICFCCDDCCGYFLDPSEKCDRGKLVEKTSMDECTHCGACEAVCFFDARKMDDGSLCVENDDCYGCGLCADVCPEDCIRLVSRK